MVDGHLEDESRAAVSQESRPDAERSVAGQLRQLQAHARGRHPAGDHATERDLTADDVGDGSDDAGAQAAALVEELGHDREGERRAQAVTFDPGIEIARDVFVRRELGRLGHRVRAYRSKIDFA